MNYILHLTRLTSRITMVPFLDIKVWTRLFTGNFPGREFPGKRPFFKFPFPGKSSPGSREKIFINIE